ncbi:Chondroadherin [Pseudolycoriella hygida]|uniref:Chondroadherin n=1 Tax=Pseudolycoriella hygida TaxID=35572 RepID=A0A9Q0N2M5_9DIPT|nr:Chondroadherin [Pseudolycoriella hygida]
MSSLEKIYKDEERENCRSDGIFLILTEAITYPNNVVKANFLPASVNVRELWFRMDSVRKVEVNAFNSNALKNLKILTLVACKLDEIKNGTFNGLESVELFVLKSASLSNVENGVLDVMSEKLKNFQLEQLNTKVNETSIDAFTGSQTMNSLETVNIAYNLKPTLTQESFIGLRNVITLDLSGCQIESIGLGAFDPMSGSLKTLRLAGNRIKTLPEGIFDSLLSNTAIYLQDNEWDCDCHLMHLKNLVTTNSNFFGPFTCYTPAQFRDNLFTNATFCGCYDSTVTTSSTTTYTNTSTTTTIEPEDPREFQQECYEAGETEQPKTVTIQKPIYTLSINETENGDVTLDVETPNGIFVLIWFSSADQETYKTLGDEINCRIGTTRSTPIPDLMEHTTYTFCLMDSVAKTVSPLDCISYTKRYNFPQPWLFQSGKGVFTGVTVVACIVSAVVGAAIGALMLVKIQKRKQNKNKSNSSINEVTREAFTAVQSDWQQKHRISTIAKDSDSTMNTTIKTNTTTVDYLDHRDVPPPLPARRVDEPIYEVV